MMAVLNKRLCSGTLGNANATLYTAPATAGAIVIIKGIILCNKTAAAVTVTIKLDGIEIMAGYSVDAYSSVVIPFADQIIEASELIEGSASSAAAVNYYISGKEVS